MSKTPVDYGKPIPVRLNADLLRRIRELSEKIGEPQSTVMRLCMRVGLVAFEKMADDPRALLGQINEVKDPKPVKKSKAA